MDIRKCTNVHYIVLICQVKMEYFQKINPGQGKGIGYKGIRYRVYGIGKKGLDNEYRMSNYEIGIGNSELGIGYSILVTRYSLLVYRY